MVENCNFHLMTALQRQIIPDRNLHILEVRMTHRNLTSHLINLILLFFTLWMQLERKSFDSPLIILLYQ